MQNNLKGSVDGPQAYVSWLRKHHWTLSCHQKILSKMLITLIIQCGPKCVTIVALSPWTGRDHRHEFANRWCHDQTPPCSPKLYRHSFSVLLGNVRKRNCLGASFREGIGILECPPVLPGHQLSLSMLTYSLVYSCSVNYVDGTTRHLSRRVNMSKSAWPKARAPSRYKTPGDRWSLQSNLHGAKIFAETSPSVFWKL